MCSCTAVVLYLNTAVGSYGRSTGAASVRSNMCNEQFLRLALALTAPRSEAATTSTAVVRRVGRSTTVLDLASRYVPSLQVYAVVGT